MVALIKALQVILALSILIVIHEAGHFTFAKLFGIRVDKFFLFFDLGDKKLFSTRSPWFVKLFPKAASWETEYGIGWLPLGGYCKISGMIDESMDLDTMAGEPKKWEFRTKPAWQRLLVMSGGVLYNFIFAILAYIAIMDIFGDAYVKNEGTAIYVNQLAHDMGFRTGDRILAFDDYVPDDFGMLQADLARRNVRKATVLRGTDTLDLYIDQSMIGDVLNTPGMFDIAVPFAVDRLMEDSPNVGADLRHGDRILSVEGTQVPYVQDSRPVLLSHKGEAVEALVLRDTDTLYTTLQVDSLGRIGVYTILPGYERREYTFLEAIPAGLDMAWKTVKGYLMDLRLLFSPRTEAYKSVGSFIAIGQVFPSAWDWYSFINILALLSIMLGVMNLLPIPALDGGHIVFCLFEMLTGRKPSDKFMIGAQMVGMFLLILLMMLAFGNDIARLIR
ncbi:MAG: RIP metalloprotease RseP [Bacteroidales bacterium]|nr:RIP metalloprotease RseP [Bacteroidales bacterium]